MTGGGNAASKWGEKKMEGEDSVRTVDCLRGRLLAERVASRNAKEEAEQLEYKLMELEKLLKQEAKSRNRAEKRLRFLMKKLQSMNISYISDESEYSSGGILVDKSDISSISSSTTTENQQIIFEIQKSDKENAKSQKGSENLQEINDSEELNSNHEDLRSQQGLENFEQNVAKNVSNGESLASASDSHSERSSDVGSNQEYNNAKIDEKSEICNHSVKSSAEEELNQESDNEDEVDNSMALVVVDPPQKTKTVDPEVLDATVKQVLDSLRRAKEQIQSSMDRRRTNMIRVG